MSRGRRGAAGCGGHGEKKKRKEKNGDKDKPTRRAREQVRSQERARGGGRRGGRGGLDWGSAQEWDDGGVERKPRPHQTAPYTGASSFPRRCHAPSQSPLFRFFPCACLFSVGFSVFTALSLVRNFQDPRFLRRHPDSTGIMGAFNKRTHGPYLWLDILTGRGRTRVGAATGDK